jgi:hypothetical protein
LWRALSSRSLRRIWISSPCSPARREVEVGDDVVAGVRGLEVGVVLDVAAVMIGELGGRAQRDVDEEGLGGALGAGGEEGLGGGGDLGVAGEELVEVGVGAAVGLHDVEHDLVDAVAAEEGVDVGEVGEVSLGDDGAGVEDDAVALVAGDGVDACEGLNEAVGGAGEALVELLGVAVDADVEAIEAGAEQAAGVGLVAEGAAVGHHRDPADAGLLGHADPGGRRGLVVGSPEVKHTSS